MSEFDGRRLTHGSHQRMVRAAFRRPKLVGDKASQRFIVGEYFLRPGGVHANGDNVRIVGSRFAENAVLDHAADRQPVIVGGRHVMHQIGFVTMQQKEMHLVKDTKERCIHGKVQKQV